MTAPPHRWLLTDALRGPLIAMLELTCLQTAHRLRVDTSLDEPTRDRLRRELAACADGVVRLSCGKLPSPLACGLLAELSAGYASNATGDRARTASQAMWQLVSESTLQFDLDDAERAVITCVDVDPDGPDGRAATGLLLTGSSGAVDAARLAQRLRARGDGLLLADRIERAVAGEGAADA